MDIDNAREQSMRFCKGSSLQDDDIAAALKILSGASDKPWAKSAVESAFNAGAVDALSTDDLEMVFAQLLSDPNHSDIFALNAGIKNGAGAKLSASSTFAAVVVGGRLDPNPMELDKALEIMQGFSAGQTIPNDQLADAAVTLARTEKFWARRALETAAVGGLAKSLSFVDQLKVATSLAKSKTDSASKALDSLFENGMGTTTDLCQDSKGRPVIGYSMSAPDSDLNHLVAVNDGGTLRGGLDPAVSLDADRQGIDR